MKKSFVYMISMMLAINIGLTSCTFEEEEPATEKPETSTGSGSSTGSGTDNSSIPSNPNIFTANGTPYFYGKYVAGEGWGIGSCVINADYNYYIFDVDAYSVQLSPDQLKEYNSGTLQNVNSVAMRIILEEFNPLTAKIGDLLKLRIVDDVYDSSGLNSRFYFFYNNSKTQIRYTFTETLKGEITFLGYENNIITLNLNNVHVYRTGTAPEDAPLEFVMNGKISYKL